MDLHGFPRIKHPLVSLIHVEKPDLETRSQTDDVY